MKMKKRKIKFYLLKGLPCIGKSTYLNNIEKDCLKIDDPTCLAEVFDKISSSKHEEVYIADCNFCVPDSLKEAKRKLIQFYPDCEIEVIDFPNDLNLALENMNKRIAKGDDRKVEGYIKYLHEIIKENENKLNKHN